MQKKITLFVLTLVNFISYSQSQSVQQIADLYLNKIIFNENLHVISDRSTTDLMCTNVGFCYMIERNYIDTTVDNIDQVKQRITSSNKWSPDPTGNTICELIDGNRKYSIYYNTKNYYEKGLTLCVKILKKLPVTYGYEVQSSRNIFDTSDFIMDPFYSKAQKELQNNYDLNGKQTIIIPSNKNVEGFNAFAGEILCDYNVSIDNDSINTALFTTESGFCYKVQTMYKEIKIKDLQKIKDKVKTTNSWNLISKINSSDIATVTDNNITHTISGSNLDSETYDLILSSEIKATDVNEGEKSNDFEYLKALEAFYISPAIMARQKELVEKDARMKTSSKDQIPLPYKLSFGWNESEIENHLKTIFPTDTISVECDFNYQELEFEKIYDDRKIRILDSIIQKNGIYEMRIHINKDSDSSLFIGVNFLNNKAYSYSYWFGDRQQSNLETLQEKIYEIKKLYKITNVEMDGHTIKLRKDERDIEDLFSNAIVEFDKKEESKRNNIGKKM